MSAGAAHVGMRLLLPLLLMSASCASPPTPATPALEVAGHSASTSSTSTSPTVLERAQAGLLFADAGPDGAAPVADPHAHHHHHGHATPVDAGTP